MVDHQPALARAGAGRARASTYDSFVAALGRRLAKGPKLRQEISEEIELTHSGE